MCLAPFPLEFRLQIQALHLLSTSALVLWPRPTRSCQELPGTANRLVMCEFFTFQLQLKCFSCLSLASISALLLLLLSLGQGPQVFGSCFAFQSLASHAGDLMSAAGITGGALLVTATHGEVGRCGCHSSLLSRKRKLLCKHFAPPLPAAQQRIAWLPWRIRNGKCCKSQVKLAALRSAPSVCPAVSPAPAAAFA